jgi:hypothetical protein
MSVRRRDRFTLRDAMFLVAVIAVGLAGGIGYHDYDKTGYLFGPSHSFPGERAVSSLTAFLLIASAGLVLIRLLRKPRPRQFALGSGTAGNLAALLSALFVAVSWINVFLHQLCASGETQTWFVYHFIANLPYGVGPSVMTVWAVLALARRWRARDWIEWAGVTLGVLWILLYVYQGLFSRWILTLASHS